MNEDQAALKKESPIVSSMKQIEKLQCHMSETISAMESGFNKVCAPEPEPDEPSKDEKSREPNNIVEILDALSRSQARLSRRLEHFRTRLERTF